jgi:hypothetical protein
MPRCHSGWGGRTQEVIFVPLEDPNAELKVLFALACLQNYFYRPANDILGRQTRGIGEGVTRGFQHNPLCHWWLEVERPPFFLDTRS